MEDTPTILVTDRNRHVRELLRRELVREGFRVLIAENSLELYSMIHSDHLPDLLILDLEMPGGEGEGILDRLRHLCPSLPIIVHTFISDEVSGMVGGEGAIVVEKSGNTERLRAHVRSILQAHLPQRFHSDGSLSS